MKTKSILLLLCIAMTMSIQSIWSIDLNAQVEQKERIEIESDETNANFNVVPWKDKSVLVFYSELSSKFSERQWQMSRYDDKLKKQWTETYTVNKRMTFRDSHLNNDGLYLLFRNTKTDEVEVSEVDESGKITTTNAELPKRFQYAGNFTVNGKYAYLAGTMRKTATIIQMNLRTGSIEFIPLTDSGVNTIDGMTYDPEKEMVNVVIQNIHKGVYTLHLYRFKKNGDDLKKIILDPKSSENQFKSASVTQTPNSEDLVMGTYSVNNKSTLGLYFTKVKNGKQEKPQYYPFADFENFASFLNERKQEKYEKKLKKREKKGKGIGHNLRLYIHDLIEDDDQYIMIAEVYYPTYRSEPYTTYINGRPTTSYRRVFDGYQYTHAVIAGFDKNGDKLWDNCFTMGGFKTFSIKQRIQVNKEDSKKIKLLYATFSGVKSQVIKGNKVVEDADYTEIEPEDYSKVKYTRSSLDYWYGNNFVSWGYQVLKEGLLKKRRVYYVSKMGF